MLSLIENVMKILAALILITWACAIAAKPAQSSFINQTCNGNIETYNRKVLQAGVTYKLSYSVSGKDAEIRFAGREFKVSIERGSSWLGLWLKRIDSEVYFSFLPDEGGTLKFEFEPNRWYSGNCL
jgi:hypothetical protein